MAKTENWQKKDDVFKAYERAIKELGDVARRVPKNTIIEKAMSYPAPRYYITLEVAIRNISLMYRDTTGHVQPHENRHVRQYFQEICCKRAKISGI